MPPPPFIPPTGTTKALVDQWIRDVARGTVRGCPVCHNTECVGAAGAVCPVAALVPR